MFMNFIFVAYFNDVYSWLGLTGHELSIIVVVSVRKNICIYTQDIYPECHVHTCQFWMFIQIFLEWIISISLQEYKMLWTC